MPFILALMLAFAMITAAPAAFAAPPAAATQLDFARKVIDALGYSEGLPENPVEQDYRAILNGNRTFRFEAEEIFDQKSDAVNVRNYPLYGPFTGSGWINGTSTPAAVHFKAFIPVSGTYTFKVSAKGNELLWSIAGRAFKVNFGESLQESRVGQIFIPSGHLEFNVLIPPAAGIDYLVFSAPAQPAIEPANGWNFNGPLTGAVLAETVSSLLANEQLLPNDTTYARTVEAAAAKLPGGAQLTDSQIYGKPVAAKWVRALHVPVTVAIPFNLEENGVYQLRIRCMGTEVTAGIGPRTVTVPAKPYLDWVELGTFRLPKGAQMLDVQLPPAGGVDTVAIARKQAAATDYLALNKIGFKADAAVLPEELDTFMKSLAAQLKERK